MYSTYVSRTIRQRHTMHTYDIRQHATFIFTMATVPVAGGSSGTKVVVAVVGSG